MTQEHANDRGSHGRMRPPKPPIWLPWILGVALLTVVVIAALHYSEQEKILRLMQRAHPWWLVAAIVLQILTYVTESGIWLRVGEASGSRLSRHKAFELSVAKLFVDQAIPSAGVGSGIFVAKALEQRSMPDRAVKAAVLLNFASFYLSYVVAMIIALFIMVRHGHVHRVVLGTAVASLVFALAVSALLLAASGHGLNRVTGWLKRLPVLRKMYAYLATADPKIVRGPRILRDTILLQLAIVTLDVGTIWTLIASLGIKAPIGAVFTSFMIASMVRMMGIVPGGLGTFEASMVLMLRLAGIDLPVALSTTLLFRGLSFWLPMLPGWWLAHRAVTPSSSSRKSTG
jgi:Mg2+-importing ATPase